MSQSPICTRPEWRGRPECAVCSVRNTVLFANLSEESLSELLLPVTNYLYEPGSVLMNQGERASALYSLRKGVVKVEQLDRNGDVTILRLLGPGAVVGLETIIEQNEPYHTRVTAISRLDACHIPVTVARRLMKEHPEHYRVIVRLWQHHLEASDEALLHFRQGELSERLLHVLKVLAGFWHGKPFFLPCGQDLSALTGATTSAISRVMAEFKRQGVLARTDKQHYRLQLQE
ncbi:MAG: Crp/Fnr family transcriptional regulator [Gammaproteobacteria bacterium]|jgi:CRP/FNR family transcriptional regulator, anaerobic regulatory protein